MSETYKKLKKFFEEDPITRQVVAPLKEGATAKLEIEGDPQVYTLVKKGGGAHIIPGEPKKYEVYFKFTDKAVDYILDVETGKLEDYVDRLTECMLTKDKEKKVEFKLTTTLMDALRKGYLGMIKLGGAKATKMLAALGIKIPERFLR